MAAEGVSSCTIVDELKLGRSACGWRRRFLNIGIQGLHDGLCPRRPRSVADEEVVHLLRRMLDTKAETRWTIRRIARETKTSHGTVDSIRQAFGLQRQRYFELSTDPFFVEIVQDFVGLYLSPPENAVLLCVDERSQIQAIDRTRPILLWT